MTFVRLAVEGETDRPIAERILRSVGIEPIDPVVTRGKARLDALAPGLNQAARGMNWWLLRDLDHDAPCPSALIHSLLAGRPLAKRLSIRIAVRAAESWLLADEEAFRTEFSVPPKHVPRNPDELPDPKQALVRACSRSRRLAIRHAMTPRPGSGLRIGPEYQSRIIHFAATRWEPERAAARSPSLKRALRAFDRLRMEGDWS